jgi:hypothetical protein
MQGSELSAGTRVDSGDDEGSTDMAVESLHQILTFGNMFGDVAIISQSPYFSTATALGKSAADCKSLPFTFAPVLIVGTSIV